MKNFSVAHLNFSKLAIKEEILANLSSLGYKQMTPIQEKSLVHMLDNKDVLAQAKTGSGKTAAFGIALLSKIDVNKKSVQAIVICPTRELAEQVAKEIRSLARLIANMKVLSLCGGNKIAPQVASLEHGAHCIVGTPGRIEDHLSKRSLNLRGVSTLVLDEADKMLDMGFSEAIDKILSYIPKKRQSLLFSATYQENIQALSKKLQNNAVTVKVDTQHSSSIIKEIFYQLDYDKRDQALLALLKNHQAKSTLVFCNTKIKCQELADYLNKKGLYVQSLHGDLDQYERQQVLSLFKNKSSSVVIATDVAARGLDIKDLELVINYELSRNAEVHTHRSGRTGRAGKNGTCLSFFCKKEEYKLKAIEELQKKKLTIGKQDDLKPSSQNLKLLPTMQSLQIKGGRKNKIRATDILGALTADQSVVGSDVGKIDIFDFHTLVAVKREKSEAALLVLNNGTIKGRKLKVKKLNL